MTPMTSWLTAGIIAFSALVSVASAAPTLASETLGPGLKISYAMAGGALQPPGTSNQIDLWDRIREGFALPESNPALVRSHEAWFAKNAGHLQRAAERSRLYLYHITEEVERRGMPMEIALLPMIESAFNPTALSPMKASGIWQFIPSTGRVYGLRQNAWYDGRRDVVEATKAALDYLQNLHQMFGDWELALAAYNCGEGCVQRAVNRHGRTYAELKLPMETRNYVPKLVAVRNIVKDPARFGVRLDPMVNEPYFMPIRLARPIDAPTAAKLAELSQDEFAALNPGFQRRVIHTDTRNVLLLPTDRVETFQFNLHRQGLDKGNLQSYAARKGESVAHIADKFNVSVAWLKDHNPIKPRNGKLTQTQELLVPKTASKSVVPRPVAKAPASITAPADKIAAQARLTPAKAAQSTQSSRKHTVRKGETLIKLAQIYNVKVSDIRQLNDIADKTDNIKPGMELDIPAAEAAG